VGSRAVNVYLRGLTDPLVLMASDEQDMIEALNESISRDVALIVTNSKGQRVILQPKSILYAIED
jgi:hypothetical protein